MATVTLTVPGTITTTDVQAELTILGDPNPIVLPITDPSAEYTNLEGDWVEVVRPGRKPLNVRRGNKLAMVKLNVTIVDQAGSARDPGGLVEGIIARLKIMANTESVTQPIALTWGAFDSSAELTETGHWRIDSLQITSTLRQPNTNNISQATATIQLKEVQDSPVSTALTSYIAAPAAPAPRATGVGSSRITVTQVLPGETLYAVAARVYGASEPYWRTLAIANGISDPRTVSAGAELLVP